MGACHCNADSHESPDTKADLSDLVSKEVDGVVGEPPLGAGNVAERKQAAARVRAISSRSGLESLAEEGEAAEDGLAIDGAGAAQAEAASRGTRNSRCHNAFEGSPRIWTKDKAASDPLLWREEHRGRSDTGTESGGPSGEGTLTLQRSASWSRRLSNIVHRMPKRSTSVERRPKTGNTNIPFDYQWLDSVLQVLVRNEAETLGVSDGATSQPLTPIFFVIGGCPNTFCGMQAVMYSVSAAQACDFWWVKPSKSNKMELEKQTLMRQDRGPYKNDPGRSAAFYKPLAELFERAKVHGAWRFGLEVDGKKSPAPKARAFFERTDEDKTRRHYLSLVWQESWTTNPFAFSKFIKGKLVYQKDAESSEFFARSYSIVDGAVTVSREEDEPWHDQVLPPMSVKQLLD